MSSPPSISISDLASLISSLHFFDSPPRLVHRGRLLDPDSTLALCGVSPGDLIVAVPPRTEISLRIFPRSCAPFTLTAHVTSAVSDLRSAVADRLALHADQIHLIHSGFLLDDSFSLSYYKLIDNSPVYVVLSKRSGYRPRASDVIDDIRGKVNRFIFASPGQRRRLAAEIAHMVDNPMLQALVRIDPSAKIVMDDADLLLEAAENPMTAELNAVVAAMNDVALSQYDTIAGLRQLREFAPKRAASQGPTVTSLKLDYEKRIAEEPLPVWWSARALDGEFIGRSKDKFGPIKERFSREVRALKRMGFVDETVILMALKETAGNVQRAAKLLRNSPNRCL